jgi:hypothetical protein
MNEVIFPLLDNKAPAVPEGTDWRQYRGKAETPLIGIMIPQGVIVFDLDTYKGVTTDQVDAALGCSLDWSSAELQRTRSGGEHYAFAVPVGADLINGQNVCGVKNFDTRSSGKGYIATGEGYTNLTFFDCVSEALHEQGAWPELPSAALELLMSNQVVAVDDDLLSVVAAQPLELNADEVLAYMSKLPQSAAEDGAQWLKIGMALYHQFAGGEQGWELFDEFSKQCKEKYDPRMNRKRWESFGKSKRANPVTFASVIELAGGARNFEALDEFETLREKAKAVWDMDSYNDFKHELQRKSEKEIGSDLRGILAAELAQSFGKSVGITKTEIKKALTQVKKEKRMAATDAPDWAKDWVYVETLCEFANTDLNYSIKKEAFNAKFDREMECIVAECSASHLALNSYQIATVVDKMYWPGADVVFDYDRKPMLNAYYKSGVEPCEEIDFDAETVIDLFMRHIEFTVADKREQRILIDWLAYVVQNPGQRVNWALLLQGAQGTGKSYFSVLLQHIIGVNLRNLDPTAIAGRFTGWAHGAQVIVVEEIRISGTNRYEVLDRMKPFLSNETIQIEEKGRDHRTVPNFTSYLLLTNHKDAIPLTHGDRRYCVLFSRVQSEEQLYAELGGEKGAEAYFNNLFNETRRRADALSHFLMNWQISDSFSPTGRAPDTTARQQMMAVATSPERLAVEDAIAEHNCEVINNDVVDVTWLNELCKMTGAELPGGRTLTAILLEMGYEQIDGKRVKIARTGKHHYIWFRGALDKNDCALEQVKSRLRVFHENYVVPF